MQSEYWRQLGAAHQADLDRYGYETIKRRQALQYFTWQWGPLSALRDPQLRFLLRHSSPLATIGASVVARDGWGGIPWSGVKRRLYTLATRLLWAYAEQHGDPRVLSLPEPERGSPLPVYLGERLISQDLANTALEVASMQLVQPASFLEVGAGYGRNAYALLNLYPRATYTIIDVEPALSIARWYLEPMFPRRVRYLSPDESPEAEPVDLALTISSLQEMTPEAVEFYLQLFDRLAANVYIKQWTKWHNPVDDVTMTLEDYPFPRRWKRVLWRQAPVQTTFTEALLTVR